MAAMRRGPPRSVMPSVQLPTLYSVLRLGFKCAQAAPLVLDSNYDSMGFTALDANEVEHHRGAPVGSAVFWWKLGLSAALVLLGGVFAGLTLGLMGLDVRPNSANPPSIRS